MIVLFTDFGSRDLYVGQVKAVLAERAPRVPVIDALHDASDFDIEAAGHLLFAVSSQYPRGCVFLAVVGPDNGLLSLIWQRARRRKCFRIAWRPERLSSSFHGRDLFAPLAAALAVKRVPRGWLAAKRAPEVRLLNEELARIIYIDHYGNAVTGLREFKNSWRLRAGGRRLAYARAFEEAEGPFWYENSMGLVEIAAPRGSAARLLRLRIGSPVAWQRSTR